MIDYIFEKGTLKVTYYMVIKTSALTVVQLGTLVVVVVVVANCP